MRQTEAIPRPAGFTEPLELSLSTAAFIDLYTQGSLLSLLNGGLLLLEQKKDFLHMGRRLISLQHTEEFI